MIGRGELVRALERRHVADWVVIEREQQLAAVDEGAGAGARVRREQRTRWTLTVHDDTPTGRGTARLELGTLDADAERIVEQTIALARAAVGQPWTSPAPAAPAKVALVDPTLADAELADAAIRVLRALPRPAGSTTTIALALGRERVAVETRQGFQTKWIATTARADALVVVGERSVTVRRDARRIADLELHDALVSAAADATQLATAGVATAGPCALRLGIDALLAGGGLGVWAAFAAQADGAVERQGLTRYRPGAPIAPGAAQHVQPLTITSDGALDFGLASSPLGDDGDAVRRFAIVRDGLAAELGLSAREAALRHRDPNGGVRNLVVAPGAWSGDIAETVAALPVGAPRMIDVRRVRSLAIDPYTGIASLELALAIEYAGGTARPFIGGTVRLDLIAALAFARRSSHLVRRDAYFGPDAVLVDHADLLA